MKRAITTAALALVLPWTGAPEAATAQGQEVWTDRPDAHAPAGVFLDHLRASGEFVLTYRFRHLEDRGSRVGSDTIPALRILQDFETVPLGVDRQLHALEGSYGILDWITIKGLFPVVHRRAELATDAVVSESSGWGLGDVGLHGLFSIYDDWPYRTHISAGLSIPTGSIDNRGVTPSSHPDPELLPYPLQDGSGTVDFLPGATFVAQNEHGSFGTQVRGVVRLGENSRDYRLGHRAQLSAWVAPRFTDWLSASLRLQWERWGNPSGSDPELDPMANQMAHPFLQSGTRVEAPFGVNVYLPEGRFQGSRLLAELAFPVHHDLDGPQLGRNWGFHLGIRVPTQVGAPQTAPATPEREPLAAVREIIPPEPEGERVVLCLSTGRNEELLITPGGDTLVGPERISVREVGAGALGGGYARGTVWFENDEPMEFGGTEYVIFGNEVGLDCGRIIQVGVYEGVPFFAGADTEEPYDTLYVPITPGAWQAYERRPEVRG